MLDQNVTTILSTLRGGTLTIAGGFIANYYIQSRTDKSEKRKELRSIMEEIFDNTHILRKQFQAMIEKIISPPPNADIDEEFFEINRILDRLKLLILVYAPPLTNDFAEYNKPLGKLSPTIVADFNNDNKNQKN